MFPWQGGNPAGVYDKYDLHNKARLWEKDHAARRAAGNTFPFIKNRGRARYYRGARRGVRPGWAESEGSARGPNHCLPLVTQSQQETRTTIIGLKGGEKKRFLHRHKVDALL